MEQTGLTVGAETDYVGPAVQVDVDLDRLPERRTVRRPRCDVLLALGQQQQRCFAGRDQEQVGALVVIGIENEPAVPAPYLVLDPCRGRPPEAHQAVVLDHDRVVAIGEYQQVEVLVVVEIGEEEADGRARGQHLGEAVVAAEPRGQARERCRLPGRIDADVLEQFQAAGRLPRRSGEGPGSFDAVGVTAEDEVEVAVLVEVGPATAEADSFDLVEPSRDRHVLERAVALVAEQMLRAGPSDDQVRPAVVVVVGSGGGETRPRRRQPRRRCHVGEDVIAFVAQQQIADLPILDDGGDEEEVGLAVAVEVEDDDRAAEPLPGSLAERVEVGGGYPSRSGGEVHLEPSGRFEHGQRPDLRSSSCRRIAADHIGVLPHLRVLDPRQGLPLRGFERLELVQEPR